MNELTKYLKTIAPGKIKDEDQKSDIECLLSDCWNEFSLPHDGGMKGEKIGGRIEKIEWNPPNLLFSIERHGGMKFGSSRAEMQNWSVNIETNTINWSGGGYRQKTPRSSPLFVKPIAEEIAKLIIEEAEDDRLKRKSDGTVRLDISSIIPSDLAPQQTLNGRRKRFREALKEILEPHGWVIIHSNVLAKKTDNQ